MEIKVRAWDGKRMLYRGINVNDRNWYTESFRGKCVKGAMPVDKNMPTMLWTGLTDKNEVEIYAGDIVSILDITTRAEPTIGEIKWNNNVTGFEAYPQGQEWGLYLHDKSFANEKFIPELESFCKHMGKRTIELLGNIHANPELLK